MITDAGIARLLADMDRDADREAEARRCAGCGRETTAGRRCGYCVGREISERRDAVRAAGRMGR